MATVVSKYSLVEQAKRIDPDGKMSLIVEALNVEMGNILEEAPWMPSNDIWINKTVRRANLPTGTRRRLNQGVATEVSRVAEILDVISMIETYAEYDKEYIDNMPSPAQARLDEATAFIRGIGQTLVSDILYGNNALNPDQITGLAPRLATIDSKFVFGGGGTGTDVTSMYVVTWGKTEAYLVYPKNSGGKLGITHEDKGRVTLEDSNSNKYEGYRDWFQVKCGMVVKNPKCVGRYANIETAGASNLFDEDNLIKLLNKMVTNANTRIYCNETIMSQAEIALKDKTNVNWTSDNGLGGVPFLKFRGMPVRKIDSTILLDTETAIT